MQDLLSDILNKGGIFCGGFVRDYLIRGEPFNDIDFFFPGEWPEPYKSWDYIRAVKNQEVVENKIDGIKYHCLKVEPLELTCNIFCFDGKKVFPRACYKPLNYLEAWELILQKKFIMQVPGPKNIRLEYKTTKKGWKKYGMVCITKELEEPPAIGPWTNFVEAKERFDKLLGYEQCK
jgi:hypothetical protein